MTPQEVSLHLRYSGWASRRLLEAARALAPDDISKPMGVSHQSLLGTLAHIYFADRIWYRRTVDPSMPAPDPSYVPPLESLTAEWQELQKKWEAWSDSLTDADLERKVQYRYMNGDPGETPAWQIVMHLVNHATLHRGQAMGLLRQLNTKPPGTDLISYYRELKQTATAP